MPQLSATPIIRVRGLVSRFGAQVVHDGLDMDVQANEIFGIVGGSGTGKSVLLRTILGLRVPDGGSVCRAAPKSVVNIVGGGGVVPLFREDVLAEALDAWR